MGFPLPVVDIIILILISPLLSLSLFRLLTGPLNILLICIPISFISWGVGWPDGVTFVFALLALAPLAERLGFVTEQVALHTNDSIGGLLNATFGNATELIVAVSGIARGLFRLVQLSLLGSILSNLLLVLGTAFLVGGYFHPEMKHEKMSAQINASLLMLATMGCVFTNVIASSDMASTLGIISLSRGISVVLFIIYLAFLVFQLKTHSHLYEDKEDEEEKVGEDEKVPMIDQSSEGLFKDTVNVICENRLPDEHGPVQVVSPNAVKTDEEGDDEDEDLLGFNYSLLWLSIITVLIAFLSDAISATIENAATSVGISRVFLSAIILPIVGNAAEHAGAIMFAVKNRLDLTLGTANLF
jgi:Ca2+:H+ antiporter